LSGVPALGRMHWSKEASSLGSFPLIPGWIIETMMEAVIR
jgi:hypothetical protein